MIVDWLIDDQLILFTWNSRNMLSQQKYFIPLTILSGLYSFGDHKNQIYSVY